MSVRESVDGGRARPRVRSSTSPTCRPTASLSVSVTVGGRDPAAATALGRVLLAAQSDEWLDDYLAEVRACARTRRARSSTPERLRAELDRIRRQGFAFVDQELEEGLRAVAAPLHDGDGRVVAAVNVALHTSRWPMDAIRSTLVPRAARRRRPRSTATSPPPGSSRTT